MFSHDCKCTSRATSASNALCGSSAALLAATTIVTACIRRFTSFTTLTGRHQSSDSSSRNRVDAAVLAPGKLVRRRTGTAAGTSILRAIKAARLWSGDTEMAFSGWVKHSHANLRTHSLDITLPRASSSALGAQPST